MLIKDIFFLTCIFITVEQRIRNAELFFISQSLSVYCLNLFSFHNFLIEPVYSFSFHLINGTNPVQFLRDSIVITILDYDGESHMLLLYFNL